MSEYDQPEFITTPAQPGYILLGLFDADAEPVRLPITAWRTKTATEWLSTHPRAIPLVPCVSIGTALAYAIVSPEGEIVDSKNGKPVRFQDEREWTVHARREVAEMLLRQRATAEAEKRWKEKRATSSEYVPQWKSLDGLEQNRLIKDAMSDIATEDADIWGNRGPLLPEPKDDTEATGPA
jgi:hypothetical protein